MKIDYCFSLAGHVRVPANARMIRDCMGMQGTMVLPDGTQVEPYFAIKVIRPNGDTEIVSDQNAFQQYGMHDLTYEDCYFISHRADEELPIVNEWEVNP